MTTPDVGQARKIRLSIPLAKTWPAIRPFLGDSGWLLVGVALISLISGFGEAALLYIVVKSATALASRSPTVDLSVGPLDATGVHISGVLTSCLGLLGFLLLLGVIESWFTARVAILGMRSVRMQVLKAYLSATWTRQSIEQQGVLQEILSSHVGRVSTSVVTLMSGVNALLSLFAYVATAIAVSPFASLGMVAAAVAMGVVFRPLAKLTRRKSREALKLNAQYAVDVTQATALVREIRVFDVSSAIVDDMDRLTGDIGRAAFITRFLGGFVPQLYQYTALGMVVSGMLVVDLERPASVATLGTIILLLVRALSYSQQINSAAQSMNELLPYLDEINVRTKLYVDDEEIFGSLILDHVDSIDLCDVSYAYGDGPTVLHGVSMRVQRGETVGIVGPSGGGKSTLAQILLRLRPPDSGEYRINGCLARDYSPSSWAAAVTLVPQENHLLTGTATENIDFRRRLQSGAVEGAATKAHVLDELEALPDGVSTRIGPGAQDLSGGQRQRVGFARALAGEPSVIVLDEPTSALDMRSEMLIQKTMTDLRGKVTMFVVAHRVSTLRHCDRILVLEGGKVTAFGKPESVAETNAFFREALRLAGSAS